MARYNVVRNGKLWKRIIIGGIAAIALTGAIAGGVALKKVNGQITTATLSTSAYTVGTLSDMDGKVDKAEKCGLFTEKYYDLENAEIKIEEKATVSVYANLYDKDKAFLKVVKISTDGKVSESAQDSSTAQYVRFEIIPEDDSDGKISLFEKGGYAKQVTITVNK